MTPSEIRAVAFRTALAMTRSRSSADDIAQDVTVKLWQHGADVGEGLVKLCARHMTINAWRRESARAKIVAPVLGDAPATQESATYATALITIIRNTLGADAELVLLDANGAGYEELARMLDLPRATVGTKLLRSKNRLRLRLAEDARHFGYRYKKQPRPGRAGAPKKEQAK